MLRSWCRDRDSINAVFPSSTSGLTLKQLRQMLICSLPRRQYELSTYISNDGSLCGRYERATQTRCSRDDSEPDWTSSMPTLMLQDQKSGLSLLATNACMMSQAFPKPKKDSSQGRGVLLAKDRLDNPRLTRLFRASLTGPLTSVTRLRLPRDQEQSFPRRIVGAEQGDQKRLYGSGQNSPECMRPAATKLLRGRVIDWNGYATCISSFARGLDTREYGPSTCILHSAHHQSRREKSKVVR